MRRSLGRGLSQLLSQSPPAPKRATQKPSPRPSSDKPKPKPQPKPAAKAKAAAPVRTPDSEVRQVPTAAIRPNSRQPRTRFGEEDLAELAASIKEVGILQPLIVRPAGGGQFELIAGERRLRAAQLAGLASVPAIERLASNQSSLEIALIENLQREDISPLEAAKAYQQLMDEFGLTQEQVARKVGKSRPAVANSVRLLRLSSRIQQGLDSGQITEGHARALMAVENPALQLALFEKVVAKGLSVRETEEATRDGSQRAGARKPARNQSYIPEWESIRTSLSERFGAPVQLQRSGNKGKLVIEFFSDDDLDRILESLGIRL